MAYKNVAVEGMELEYVNEDHSGDIELSPPSNDVFADGKKVYASIQTVITITNGSNGSNISNATGSAPMQSTAIGGAINNFPVLREGEITTVPMIGDNSSPPPAKLPYSTQVRIKDANQNQVVSE